MSVFTTLLSVFLSLLFAHWFWIVAFWVVGLIGYIVIPFAVRSQWIMDHHARTAFKTLGRSLLVARETSSDHSLVPIKYDGNKGVETVKVGGNKRHVADELNVMGRLYGQTFGVLDERYSVISNLRLALIGKLDNEMELDGVAKREVSWTVEVEEPEESTDAVAADGGTITEKRRETAYADRYAIPKTSPLLDIRDIEYIEHGSAAPTDFETAYDFTTKSQERFWSKMSTTEILTWIAAFVVPFFAIGIGADQFGGAAGGTVGRVISGTVYLDPTLFVGVL